MPSKQFKALIDQLSDAGNDVRFVIKDGQLKLISEVNP